MEEKKKKRVRLRVLFVCSENVQVCSMASQMYVVLLRQSVIIIIILASCLRRFSSHVRPRIPAHERLVRFFTNCHCRLVSLLLTHSLTHLLAILVRRCMRAQLWVWSTACLQFLWRAVCFVVHSFELYVLCRKKKKNIMKNRTVRTIASAEPSENRKKRINTIFFLFITKFEAK